MQKKDIAIMGILHIGVLAILGIILASLLTAQRPEYSIYIIIVVSLFLFLYVLGIVEDVRLKLGILTDIISGSEKYFSLLFKMLGITYLCEFCSGICKDAGYQGMAGQVEMFGKISIVLSGLPILFALVKTIQKF